MFDNFINTFCESPREKDAHVDRFGAMLPYLEMDYDGIMVLEGVRAGTVEGLGFTLELIPQTGLNEEMERVLLGLYDGLPPGSTVVMTLMGSQAIEPLTRLVRHVRDRTQSVEGELKELFCRMSLAREEMFNRAARHQRFKTAPVYVRNMRLWLSSVIPAKGRDDKKARATIFALREKQISSLRAFHLFDTVWDRSLFAATLSEILSPQKVRAATFTPAVPVRREEARFHLVDADTEITVLKEGLRFEGDITSEIARANRVLGVALSVRDYPERLTLAHTAALIGASTDTGSKALPVPFLLSSWVETLAPTERSRIQAKRLRAKQMSDTEAARYLSDWSEALPDLELAAHSYEHGAGVARVSQTLWLFCPEEEAGFCVQAAQDIAKSHGMTLQRETAMHLQAFFSVLPMAAGPLLAQDAVLAQRLPRRTLETAVESLPLMGEWRGTGRRSDESCPTPLLTLIGRKGQLMFVDPFANPSGGYSGCIVGKPGSGKSVVCNELALSLLAMGGLVWIIDVGRSYEKLAGLVGGDFLLFSENEIWDVNPFSLLENDSSLESLSMVVDIIAALLSGETLPDFERAVLMQCVSDVAQNARLKGRCASMDELREAFFESSLPNALPDRRLLDLATQLAPYCCEGAFAQWFDGTGKRIDFKSSLTVLELEGLNAHPTLRSAVLMMLMLKISQSMTQERARAKLTIIDEAWDLMRSKTAGAFIESGYRRARKHKGAFFTATQAVSDYFANPTVRATWDCADTRILLRQSDDAIAAMVREGAVAAESFEVAAMKTLTTQSGAWSEMLVKVGDAPATVGRLLLDDVSRIVYSSAPADVTAVKAWQKRGASLTEAILHVAQGDKVEEQRA